VVPTGKLRAKRYLAQDKQGFEIHGLEGADPMSRRRKICRSTVLSEQTELLVLRLRARAENEGETWADIGVGEVPSGGPRDLLRKQNGTLR
jgi:hypothetical protein